MAVDQILKRQFWAVILVLTGVAAFFDAQGVTQLAGAGLAPDESALSAPPVVPRVPPMASGGTSHSTNADAILARNPFDSVTGRLFDPALPDLSDAGDASLYVLEEGAPDVRGIADLATGDQVFFIGDPSGFDEATRARLKEAGARPVSVGPVSLHAEDVVTLVSNEIDRRSA